MMKRFSFVIVLAALFLAPVARGQQGNTVTVSFPGTPTGSCSSIEIGINSSTGAFYNCKNGAWNLVGVGPATFNVLNYGAKGDGRVIADISNTAGSPIITSAGAANFTQADVGKTAWVTAQKPPVRATTLECGSVTADATTTVLSVQSATQITLSRNCTFTGGPTDVLFIGTDDSAAISSACAALAAARGGTIYSPRGVYILGNGVSPNPACNWPATNNFSAAFIGDGTSIDTSDSTVFYVAPSYNHTFNFGTVFSFQNTGYTYTNGWRLDGAGVSLDDGVAGAVVSVGQPVWHDVAITDFEWRRADNECVYMSGSAPVSKLVSFTNVLIDCRQIAFEPNINYEVLSLTNNFFRSNNAAITASANAGNLKINLFGGAYATDSPGGGPVVGNPGALAIPFSGTPAGITVNAYGTVFCAGQPTTFAINIQTDATVNLHNVRINQANDACVFTGTNPGGVLLGVAGATLSLAGTKITANGTGTAISNAGTVFDGGNNILSGTGTMTSGSAGFFRLSPKDVINFRNNANTADILALSLNGSDQVVVGSGTSGVIAPSYSTTTNCVSSASPAVCGSAAAGHFVLAATATTVTVNTTAVTTSSQIFIQNDDSLGTRLAVTCNTALDQVFVSARIAGTSFTITGTAPVTNPNCYSYFIVN